MVGLDNKELERTWKEAVVVTSDAVYHPICLEGLSKTIEASVRRGGVKAEIRSSRLYNKVRRVAA
jgi:hypothetical protein